MYEATRIKKLLMKQPYADVRYAYNDIRKYDFCKDGPAPAKTRKHEDLARTVAEYFVYMGYYYEVVKDAFDKHHDVDLLMELEDQLLRMRYH